MTLVKWNAPRSLNTFDTGFDRLVDDVFNNFNFWPHTAEETWSPRVDIAETKDNYVTRVELPGVEKDDLSINIEDNVLTIKGEKKAEEKQEGVNYHRVERGYGRFERSFNLSDSVDADNISAAFKNGVLTIQLPKAEKAKPREIEVKVN